MDKLLLILLILLNIPKANSVTDCSQYYRFNVNPTQYIQQFNNQIPGSFRYKQHATRNGIDVHEMYERSDRLGRSYGHIMFDYHENQQSVVIARLRSTENSVDVEKLLLAKVMSDFPYAKNIQTTINVDDFKLYADAIENGRSKSEALTELPIYKMFREIGFGKINLNSTVIENEHQHIVLVMDWAH